MLARRLGARRVGGRVARHVVPGHDPDMVRVVALCLLLLASCSGVKTGGNYRPMATSGWVGQPVADFVATNPNAKLVYEDDTLHLFQKSSGYGHCDVAVRTDGEVISEVVTMCPVGMLELMARPVPPVSPR